MARDKHPTERTGRNPKLHESTTEDSKPAHQTGKVEFLSRLTALPKKAWNRIKDLDRNTKLAASLALVLVAVGFFTVILSTGSKPSQQEDGDSPSEISEDIPKTSASITLKQGTVEIKNANGDWEDVAEGASLQEYARLRTVGATSKTVVAFEDGSELRLDANSEIEITSLNTQRIEIKQTAGYSYHRLLAAESRTYIVFSNDAHYESLGTAFKVASTGDEQSVEVYHNNVHETSTNKKVAEGQKLTVNNRSTPGKNGEVEKLDIEAVKQDPFVIWNISLDKANDNFKNDLGFLRDTEAPELSVSDPADGSTVLLDPDAAEGSTTFSGKTEKGATLTVQSKSLSNSSPVNVTVGSDGSFTTPVMTAPLGSSVFEFVARDRNGNKTTLNIRINLQRKSAPVSSGGLSLQAKLNGAKSKVQLSWAISGNMTLPDGVQLLYGKSSNPSFGTDSSIAVKNKTSYDLNVNNLDSGEKYYFRVCAYDADNDTVSSCSSQQSVAIP